MRAEAFASSRVYFSEFNDVANSQRPYWLANANIRYDATDDWYASLYLNNIFDKTIVAGTFGSTPLVGAFVNRQYLPPRRYGVRIGKQFGSGSAGVVASARSDGRGVGRGWGSTCR